VTSENADISRSDRWGARKTLAAVAVAAAIGGVGGGAIYAATEGSAHSMPGMKGGPMHGPGQGGPPRPNAHPNPAGAVHGEYVVADGHGGFSTKLTQTGTVDEVTASSIVVRSDDGYTQIYALPPGSTGSTAKPDETVSVEATRTGATVTLNSIGEGPPHRN
jgi:hypothetical protein